MDWRRMAIFVVINIVVSAIVVLIILSIWDAQRPTSAPPAFAPSAAQSAVTTALPPTGASASAPAATQPLPPTSTLVSPSATPSGPFVYQIEAGDTLGALALSFDVPLEDLLEANDLTEDAILSLGQEIIIPIGGSTTLDPTPDAPASDLAFVTIREITSGGELGTEVLILTNLGETVNLTDWTLSDGNNNRFTFPALTMFADAEIKLHTISGSNTASDLYWGESEARWSESSTVAYLRDADGKLVATYRVP